MNHVPAWAMKIIRTQAAEHRRRRPDVAWRLLRSKQKTSGSWDEDLYKLSITAGWDQVNLRLTLLHEIAHWLTGDGHNSQAFWLLAWALYRRYRVPIGYALRDEAKYKQAALPAYWASRDRRGRRPTNTVKITTTVNAGPPM